MMAGTLAVIPARGGSKGIPRKNIRPLGGVPLVARTIGVALRAASVERVVVSTDDQEIGEVAQRWGAGVVWRPAQLATDEASSEAALLNALEQLREAEGYEPDVLVFLQCTSPFTTSEEIDGTVQMVLRDGCDTAVTMVPFHHFIWKDEGDGRMRAVNHDATRRQRRQDREPEYQEVGAVYAMRVSGFLQHRFRFFGRIGRHLVPAHHALELDTVDDWQLAEALLAREASVHPEPTLLRRIRAVVTDFDGVLTDNRVHVDQDGRESVVCNRGDGWGIGLLQRAGIQVACISTETNPVVASRCRKLGIPYWQGQSDKLSALKSYLEAEGIGQAECLYVGNDTNDAACLAHAGLAVVPADANPEVLSLADWRTTVAGGEGVLREVAHVIQSARSGKGRDA